MQIVPYDKQHLEAIVRLSLRAWSPVFDSIQNAMDINVYRQLHPDWRVSQRQAVEDVCTAEDSNVWVAIKEETAVGFVAVKLHTEAKIGEIYMVAVDPDHQRQGIASALTDFALKWTKKAGMTVAMVETGGDPGHAPARHTYEKMGFGLLPIARYFKQL